MKAFTDLEQSRKLVAGILPPESADMYWWYSGKRYYIESMDDGDFNEKVDIPAWSLTALLYVMPNPSLHQVTDGWRCDCYDKDDNLLAMCYGENPIDACYKMILDLHEFKLL